ncbi:MAG: electron transfer flavoprotein-ubiquinone oxidoreductase [Gammaproteobacteria bacterium]|nr:electron transfer flavoprotein-ubiquinone oxidoreductase [Gammaproteobacteria bacterium]
MARERMDFDVIIIGAGPSGLSAAIRLAQLGQQLNVALSICVLDKGAEVGSHILSGAVLEPRALNELIPDWQQKNAPINTPVIKDEFNLLTEKKSYQLPTPPQMHNSGNYIISLGKLCRWLAEQAESLGVNIFSSFAATDILYEDDRVVGVITGDKGVDRTGQPTSRYQPGMELFAKQTFFAEGCRGSLTKKLIEKFHLREGKDPQTYGLGIKELWEIPEELHQPGLVSHSIGWPLDNATYGGSFVYHFEKNLIEIGFIVGLDYQNPFMNPYEEFQRFKSHPSICRLLEKGKRLAYGARSLNEGGYQSIPKLSFAGGLLIGCAAGFLNVPKIKGIHNAMKSGMVAAESVFSLLKEEQISECESYPDNMQKSWVWKELYEARNLRPAFTYGLWPGLIYAAIDTYIFRGKAPWTFHNHADHLQLKKAADCKKIDYPKHDNKVTFDLLTSLYLANVQYEENQPYHLKLANRQVAIDVNYKLYDSPEKRYCPAGVYEIIFTPENTPRLMINGGNCIHCKACDIKDPTQNITWTPSEGGSGPTYEMM